MTESLRVLHVIASLAPVHGGTTSAVLQMIQALASNGITCEIASSDDNGPGQQLASNAPERSIPGRHYFAKRADLWMYSPAFGHWLETNARDFHLVHIHGLFSHLNGVAGRVCRGQGVPYVVTPHGMANRYGLRHKALRKKISLAIIERPLLQGAAMIHMTARSEQRDFAKLKIHTPVVRIPLAVQPVPQACPEAFRSRNPETRGRRIAIFAGRINPIKNLENAIDALALAGCSDWHLVVCGDGPHAYTAALRARAEMRGVAQRVSWLGFIGERDKANVFAAGDLYLQPSLSESFGIAAVEAVSAGLPCVLGENVAVAEDLVRAGFAVAVPPTAESLAEALPKAIQLKSGDTRFTDRARMFVKNCFSSKTIGAHLTQAYATAIDGRGRPDAVS